MVGNNLMFELRLKKISINVETVPSLQCHWLGNRSNHYLKLCQNLNNPDNSVSHQSCLQSQISMFTITWETLTRHFKFVLPSVWSRYLNWRLNVPLLVLILTLKSGLSWARAIDCWRLKPSSPSALRSCNTKFVSSETRNIELYFPIKFKHHKNYILYHNDKNQGKPPWLAVCRIFMRKTTLSGWFTVISSDGKVVTHPETCFLACSVQPTVASPCASQHWQPSETSPSVWYSMRLSVWPPDGLHLSPGHQVALLADNKQETTCYNALVHERTHATKIMHIIRMSASPEQYEGTKLEINLFSKTVVAKKKFTHCAVWEARGKNATLLVWKQSH